MGLRPILRWPDQRLRQKAAPVESFDAALSELASDLLKTLRDVPGIGITAPHVGVPLRLVVLELPGTQPSFFVNPVILWTSPETVRHKEGSVSMPGAEEVVERAARIGLAYQDLAGGMHEEEAEGFAAICHQHEIDQLDGIFWLQRLSKLKRDMLARKWEKTQRG